MHPLRLYAECLRTPSEHGEQRARFSDGTAIPLRVDRYLGPADATDKRLLTDVRGPVLDVGCGPGRHLHALAARGIFALGVDLSPVAVDLARGGGARAIVASIFDELPGSGTWRSALLLDGNIGIGGAPARLLARIGSLLTDDGEVLVELDPPDTATAPLRALLVPMGPRLRGRGRAGGERERLRGVGDVVARRPLVRPPRAMIRSIAGRGRSRIRAACAAGAFATW
jgi:SAM-dependent methyltransferase